ncbi:Uncharacterised protein at_DN0448 [Pycnogonum litorale]
MAAFCCSLEKIIIKYAILSGVHSIVVGFWLHIMRLISCISVALIRRQTWCFQRKEAYQLLGYSVTAIGGTGSMFFALSYLPALEVTVILQAQTIFVIIIENLLNKKIPKWYDLVIYLCISVGIVLIAKPEFIFGYKQAILVTNQTIGSLLAISASIMFATKNIFNSKMLETDFSVISTTGTIMTSCFFLVMIFSVDVGVIPDLKSLCVIFTAGLFASFGTFMKIYAVQIEDVINVSLAMTMDILFSFILQLIIFTVYPDYYICSGTFLMMLGVYGIFMKKKYSN